MNSNPIALFDSGVGGVTVLKEVLKQLPNENIIYFADTVNSPYGAKNIEQLQEINKKILEYFEEKKAKLMIIACNTATAASLEYLKTISKIPIFGVIQFGAKDALKATKNNHISVASTVFTANSHSYANKIKQLSTDKNVVVNEIGNPDLCTYIEFGFKEINPDDYIKDFVKKIPDSSDTLILGCTHYPLLKDNFSKHFKGNIIDPAESTVKFVKDFILKNKLEHLDNKNKTIKYKVSGDVEIFKETIKNMANLEADDIEKVTL